MSRSSVSYRQSNTNSNSWDTGLDFCHIIVSLILSLVSQGFEVHFRWKENPYWIDLQNISNLTSVHHYLRYHPNMSHHHLLCASPFHIPFQTHPVGLLWVGLLVNVVLDGNFDKILSKLIPWCLPWFLNARAHGALRELPLWFLIYGETEAQWDKRLLLCHTTIMRHKTGMRSLVLWHSKIPWMWNMGWIPLQLKLQGFWDSLLHAQSMLLPHRDWLDVCSRRKRTVLSVWHCVT